MKRYSHAIFIAAGALLALFLGFRLASLFIKMPQGAVTSAADEPVFTASGIIGEGTSNGSVIGSGTYVRVASTPAPVLNVHAAMIADPANGEVLFNVNPTTRWPSASLTKLMTATVIREHMDMTKVITLDPTDFEGGGNTLTASLEPGDAYRASDLLKIMLVSSSNEAAAAFARVYGTERFVAAMNGKAAEWGLINTHFADPAGISIGNQSTPREFIEMAIRILRSYPDIFETTRAGSVGVVEWQTGARKVFQNTNEFVSRTDFLGGKTGTTPEAGENLVTLFSYRAHPVIILVFGSESRYKDTEALYHWFTHDFSPGN
jgi:D-alanyl-D-alanine carboxypeptidase